MNGSALAGRMVMEAALYFVLLCVLDWPVALAVFVLHWFVNIHAEGIALRARTFGAHYRIARRYTGRARAAWIAWQFVRAWGRSIVKNHQE